VTNFWSTSTTFVVFRVFCKVTIRPGFSGSPDF